jgi:hypothetical protein
MALAVEQQDSRKENMKKAGIKNFRPGSEKGGASRGAKAPDTGEVPGRPNDESSMQIHEKHFGHVLKTASALHGKDPYKASHKL